MAVVLPTAAGSAAPAARLAPHSQTLDRGLRALELLAGCDGGLTINHLAAALAVHRSIAYRILRTLADHRLVVRRADGCWELGVGLAVLARGVSPTLHSAATPELAELANDLGMTAFLAVADRDECLTVLTVEPRQSAVHVAYRPGARHALDRGAPGLALLAGGRPQSRERPEVTQARADGFALTRGEVLPGLSSIAAPVLTPALGVVAAVAVVFLPEATDEVGVSRSVVAAATAVARKLS